MKPCRIYTENFKTHRLIDIDLRNIQSAIILGSFHDDDGNSMGVGKSTIFEAIEFALTGEASVKLDKILRDGIDKCKVIFEFEIKNIEYQVTRTRTKSGKTDLNLAYKANNVWNNSLTQKTSTETENELKKIIKINRQTYKNLLYFPQTDPLRGLPALKPTERRALLKEIINIAIYSKYEKRAKEKTSFLSKELDRLKVIIENLGDPAQDLLNLYNEKKLSEEDLFIADIQRQSLITDLNNKQQQLADLNRSIALDNNELKFELNKAQQNIKQQQSKLSNLQTRLKEQETAASVLRNNLERSAKELVFFENQKNSLLSLSLRDLKIVQEDLSKISNKETEGKIVIAGWQAKRTEQTKSLTTAPVCSECKQFISDEYRKNCEDNRREELAKTEANLSKCESVLKAVQNKKKILEEENKKIVQNQQNLATVEKEIIKRQASIESDKKVLEQRLTLVQSTSDEVLTLVEAEKNFQQQEEILRNKIAQQLNNRLVEELNKLNVEVGVLEKKKSAVEDKINILNMSFGVLQEKIRARTVDQAKLTSLQEELPKKQKEFSIRLKIQESFSPSGIPSMIINTILDDLQIIVNEVLQQIRPEIEVVFLTSKINSKDAEEDTLDIIYRVNSIEREFGQLSGGQQMLISWCFKRALKIMQEQCLDTELKMFLLDEADSHFDKNALEEFVTLIKKWQEDTTILVISHNEYVKKKFSHAIMIAGDEINGSTGKLIQL